MKENTFYLLIGMVIGAALFAQWNSIVMLDQMDNDLEKCNRHVANIIWQERRHIRNADWEAAHPEFGNPGKQEQEGK